MRVRNQTLDRFSSVSSFVVTSELQRDEREQQVKGIRQRENQRMSMSDLEALSSIGPITTTSTGDSE